MSDLARRSSRGVQPTSAVGRGGLSTAGLAFEGRGHRWEDLPAVVHEAAAFGGADAAAEVDSGTNRVQHRDGMYWQPWTAWIARQGGISLIRIRRLMARLEGKKFKPTGELVVDRVEEYAAASPPTRRRATLPSLGSAGREASSGSSASESDDEGLNILAYLPEVVQHEVLTDIPAPSYSHGCLWQMYSRNDLPIRQELAVLRLAASSAVVVSASKEVDTLPAGIDDAGANARVAAQPWEVTRYRYRLNDSVVHGELTSK